MTEFKELIKKNKKEYDDICKCIQTYEGNEPIPPQSTLQEPIPLQPPLQEPTPSISATRNTAPGRKAVSKLPEGCGVKVEDIPKYCYYVAKTDKRGDKFVIDRHPKFGEGVRQWGTTGSSTKTTLEKFNMLKEKLNELN